MADEHIKKFSCDYNTMFWYKKDIQDVIKPDRRDGDETPSECLGLMWRKSGEMTFNLVV